MIKKMVTAASFLCILSAAPSGLPGSEDEQNEIIEGGKTRIVKDRE
jgi:hypothetical protein